MAKLNDRRCHVAFMDSRAAGLQEKIDALNDGEYLGIREHKSASLQHLSRQAGRHLVRYPFDVVYIAGGACDITYKENNSNAISFNWDPPGGICDHLLATLANENERLRKEHPAAKVVFCPLVGIDLQRVVNKHAVGPDQQGAVDEAVFKFNSAIFKANKERGTYAPSLHRTVHRSTKGLQKSHYHHLDDGIHLTEGLKDNWASAFVKATVNN